MSYHLISPPSKGVIECHRVSYGLAKYHVVFKERNSLAGPNFLKCHTGMVEGVFSWDHKKWWKHLHVYYSVLKQKHPNVKLTSKSIHLIIWMLFVSILKIIYLRCCPYVLQKETSVWFHFQTFPLEIELSGSMTNDQLTAPYKRRFKNTQGRGISSCGMYIAHLSQIPRSKIARECLAHFEGLLAA